MLGTMKPLESTGSILIILMGSTPSWSRRQLTLTAKTGSIATVASIGRQAAEVTTLLELRNWAWHQKSAWFIWVTVSKDAVHFIRFMARPLSRRLANLKREKALNHRDRNHQYRKFNLLQKFIPLPLMLQTTITTQGVKLMILSWYMMGYCINRTMLIFHKTLSVLMSWIGPTKEVQEHFPTTQLEMEDKQAAVLANFSIILTVQGRLPLHSSQHSNFSDTNWTQICKISGPNLNPEPC